MILRNHGLLAVGATVPEAFVTIYWLERACQAQVARDGVQHEAAPAGAGRDREDQRALQARPAAQDRRARVAGLLRLVERRYPGFRD